MKQLILISTIIMLSSMSSNSQSNISQEEQFVNALLQKMTIEEKAGQMTQVNITVLATQDDATNLPTGARALDPSKLQKALVDCNVGSVLNALEGRKHLEGWHEIISDIQFIATTKTRLKIPVLYGVDAIHGATYLFGSTLFPHNIGMAASRNTDLEKQSAIITALETKATGVKWNFDPVFDIGRQPLWPRFPETYGEDVAITKAFGVAAVKGYEESGIASCMKHYVGYSKPATGWDRTPAYIPEIELREYYLPQFKAAIEAGSRSIMINSGDVNGIPTHANKYLLTDVLRKELGFKGLAVSDWEDIIMLHTKHKVANSPKEAVKMAVLAGVDMSMVPMDLSFYHLLVDLVKQGEIPITRIDEAVKRILILKYQLGLFTNPYPDKNDFVHFKQEKYKQVALASALESMTLLKNNNQTLPLKSGKKILLAGPSANNKSSLHGCWSYSWQGNEEFRYPEATLTIKQAFENRIGKENVICESVAEYDNKANFTLKSVQEVDYVVLCVGENAYAETPGSIKDLNLDFAQQNLVFEAHKYNKPIVLVLAQGRPRLITQVEPKSDAILLAYWPGEKGAEAIVQTLMGDYNPHGKLPFTYPKYTGHQVLYDCKYSETGLTGTQEGFTYNGYDPQFPFGHGLSYSTFEYSNLNLSTSELKGNNTLTVSVTVKNTSQRDGKEAIDLFSRDLFASVTPSYRRLRKFTQISLKAGESKAVSFELKAEDFMFVNANHKMVIEEGDFEIIIKDLVKGFSYKF